MTEQIREPLRAYLAREILHDANYPLADDEPLISSGLIDSFSLVDIALWVENQFGVRIDDIDLNADSFDTLAQLVSFIVSQQP